MPPSTQTPSPSPPNSTIVLHLCAALFLRLLMLSVGTYQDSLSESVKYTDIDYSVYSDAAKYVMDGLSPYLRETYRYTPILAWILTPIWTLHPAYGKIVFILFDLLTGYLIYLITKKYYINSSGSSAVTASDSNRSVSSASIGSDSNPANPSASSRGNSSKTKRLNSSDSSASANTVLNQANSPDPPPTSSASAPVKWALLWLYNPLPIIICTRGSSESIILALVLSTLYFYQNGAIILAGLAYGFSVHFKPYTIPYCLPLYLAAGGQKSFWKLNFKRIVLITSSAVGFLIPTGISYYFYGQEFLQETYFYHITRKDHRHNFSLYFYMLYLNMDENRWIGLIAFIPQVLLLVGTAFLFPKGKDLPFTFFIQTYCFVIFNKVSTSQYFLWYLSLLPLISPKINMKWTHALVLLMVWYFIQVAWLLPAYYLEFEGRNTFMYVWLESIAFYCGNLGILVQIVKNYNN